MLHAAYRRGGQGERHADQCLRDGGPVRLLHGRGSFGSFEVLVRLLRCSVHQLIIRVHQKVNCEMTEGQLEGSRQYNGDGFRWNQRTPQAYECYL